MNNAREIFFDSEIKCINYNYIKGNDILIFTSKSNLYYTNLLENISIKIFTFINGENHILCLDSGYHSVSCRGFSPPA